MGIIEAKTDQGDLSSQFKDELINNTSLTYNVGQNCVTVSSERIKLVLIDNISKITSRLRYLTPLSVFLTIFLSLLTTEFRDRFGLSKDAWFGFFVACALITLAVSVIFGISAIRAKKVTIDTIVEQIVHNESNVKQHHI
jgi:hypothetical protein